ncbi:MAG: hypothetical protein VB124_03775 [Burkholderia sp.]
MYMISGNPFALPEIMYIGLASSSCSIYATTPVKRVIQTGV